MNGTSVSRFRKKLFRHNRKEACHTREKDLLRQKYINLILGRPSAKNIPPPYLKSFWLKRIVRFSSTRSSSAHNSSSSTEDGIETETDLYSSESDSVGGVDADIEDFQDPNGRPREPFHQIRRKSSANSRHSKTLDDSEDTADDVIDDDIFIDKVPERSYEFVYDDDYSRLYRMMRLEDFDTCAMESIDEGAKADVEDCLDTDNNSELDRPRNYFGIHKYFVRFLNEI